MIGGSGRPLLGGWGPGGAQRTPVSGRVFDRRVMERLGGYLAPYRGRLMLTFLLVAVSAAMQVIGPYLLKVAIDSYLITTQDPVGLTVVSLAFALTLLVSYLSQSNQSYLMA